MQQTRDPSMAGVSFGSPERFPSTWNFMAERTGAADSWPRARRHGGLVPRDRQGLPRVRREDMMRVSPSLQGRGGFCRHHSMGRRMVGKKVRIQIEYCAE
jgi:hypothetical protein